MSNVLTRQPIGVLGGTFDPIHYGHLRIAIEIYEQCHLAEVRLIPSAFPPLRQPPLASAELRLTMVKLALHNVMGLTVDDREFKQTAPSYTVNTLQSLRRDYPDTPLCFIIGMDAFINLPKWHQWQQLSELAHFIILQRPNYALPSSSPLHTLLAKQVSTPQALRKQTAGLVFFANVPSCDISATRIRKHIAAGKQLAGLVPASVLEFIQTHQLYLHTNDRTIA